MSRWWFITLIYSGTHFGPTGNLHHITQLAQMPSATRPRRKRSRNCSTTSLVRATFHLKLQAVNLFSFWCGNEIPLLLCFVWWHLIVGFWWDVTCVAAVLMICSLGSRINKVPLSRRCVIITHWSTLRCTRHVTLYCLTPNREHWKHPAEKKIK